MMSRMTSPRPKKSSITTNQPTTEPQSTHLLLPTTQSEPTVTMKSQNRLCIQPTSSDMVTLVTFTYPTPTLKVNLTGRTSLLPTTTAETTAKLILFYNMFDN